MCGPEVQHLKHLPKFELTEVIRKRVAGLTCVTFSGLVSQALIEAVQRGLTTLDRSDLREQIWAAAQVLRARGLPLDRQLDGRSSFEARFERFLHYAHRQGGILQPASDMQTLQLDLAGLSRQDCNKHSDNPVRYCYNELTELLEVWQPQVVAPAEAQLVSEFALSAKRRSRLTAG